MIFDKIKEILGEGNYLDKQTDMEPYLSSWRGGKKGDSMLVCFPDSVQKISDIVKTCTEVGLAIVPQGGNTGLVDGSIPSSEDEIVINLSRMNKVREIDLNNHTVTVEAGCILEKLQNEVKEKDLLFPISMASEGSCEIGGIVSTNAGGVNVLHYGNTRDMVLGLEVVLPDGQIYNGLRGLRKDNTGYDLKQLFIGAEGTLGIVTAVTLKLFPQPKQVETVFLAVPYPDSAVKLLSSFRAKTGDSITAFEIISATALNMVIENVPGTRSPLSSFSEYYILIELSTSQEGDGLRTQLEKILEKEFNNGTIIDTAIAETIEHAKDFWRLRESISEALKKSGRGVHFDISLPVSKIPDFINSADMKIISKYKTAKIVNFGHLGDGNLHYNISFPADISDVDFKEAKAGLKEIIYGDCLERGGSISAEHGIGKLRKKDLKIYKSQLEIDLMKKIKKTFDPENILNPGKIF